MQLRKKVECFIRAILYPNSNIIVGYKDVLDSQNAINELTEFSEQYPIIKNEIKNRDGSHITFKNGSRITILSPSDRNNCRGKRADIPIPDWSDCLISQEVIDEVLSPFIKKMREHPSKYAFYVTGKKLPLWQCVWIDKVYPIIERIKW